ncbi:ABC transporter ATP-binding protein [Arcticibacter sp.]|uniref:ABC transporter ATP-binding protein n=1 Tax=Arcticibacter sp. TaxID=1872630 RepID=UPI00388E35DA
MVIKDAIELHGVSKTYQIEPFGGVKSVSFSVPTGAVTVIAGESGSGKSTLLKLISGLLEPDSGHVLFKGQKVKGPSEKLIPGHEAMKMVAQDFNLDIYAKAYDNIARVLPNTDLKNKRIRTIDTMEFLKIDHLAGKRVVDLSGGEQQRVAIARAIITQPEVLLLDEPFSQIDSVVKTELRADIRRMSHFLGITVVLVSHDPTDALALADHMIILKNGRNIETGSAAKLYNFPGSLYTARLLSDCNVLTSKEASELGIKSDYDRVVIYLDWLCLSNNTTGPVSFQVKDKLFKGFYEELILEREGVIVRARSLGTEGPVKGSQINVTILRYLEFED